MNHAKIAHFNAKVEKWALLSILSLCTAVYLTLISRMQLHWLQQSMLDVNTTLVYAICAIAFSLLATWRYKHLHHRLNWWICQETKEEARTSERYYDYL